MASIIQRMLVFFMAKRSNIHNLSYTESGGQNRKFRTAEIFHKNRLSSTGKIGNGLWSRTATVDTMVFSEENNQ